MTRDENTILEELTPVFRTVFENDRLVIVADMTAKDIDGWDSLAHMSLIVAVEDRYKIRFALGDIVKFKNIGDMCKAVLKSQR